MPELLTCPLGHRWEAADGADVCPVCHPPGGPIIWEESTATITAPAPLAATRSDPEPPADHNAATIVSDEPAYRPRARPLPTVPGYEVLDELGRGGMGVVYKARQISLNRTVALKMILAGAHASAETLNRFRTEAESVAALQHPNIVQIHEVGEQDGCPFFSLEFVDGGSLDERLDGTPLPARLAAEIVECLGRAMHYAHRRGIIHRDLKPGNILLQTAEGGAAETVHKSPSGREAAVSSFCIMQSAVCIPKVTDFGLAKRLQGDSGQTASGIVVGTPNYMAPEQAQGRVRDIGPGVDVYALGAILYELLTGRPPFLGETPVETMRSVVSDEPVPPSRLQARVPRDLETVCLKCLEKDPRKRYASAEELADDLRRFLDGQPIRARAVSVWERGVKWARRRPAVAALLAVSVLAAAALLAGEIWHHREMTVAYHEARQRRDEAEAERRQAVARLVQLNVVSGMRLVEDGDPLGSLPRFVEALRLDEGDGPRGQVDRVRLAAVLRACPRQARVWFHGGQVNHAEFSADGRRVVTAGADGAARVFDVAGGGPAAATFRHDGPVNWAAFSPDGKQVVTAGADGTARVWDARASVPVARVLKHDGPVRRAVFDPDGRRVLTASDDHCARVWDPADGKVLVLRHKGPVTAAVFSPGGKRVLTVSDDRTARVWDAAAGEPVTPPLEHAGPVRCGAFGPDGRRVATAAESGRVRVWSVATGRLIGPPLRHERQVNSVAFSRDGRRLLTASADRTARVWDVASGFLVGPPLHHKSEIMQAVFSPDGRRIATAGDDNTARVWDLATGRALSPLLKQNGTVFTVAFSPDGRCLLTASQDGTARVWQAPGPAGAPAAVLQPDLRSVRPTASPDGSLRLEPRGRDAVVITRGGRAVGAPLRHQDMIYRACFSPDGTRVLTASADWTARVWDAATGKPVTPPLRHGSKVYQAAFSPDGRRVVTGSDDNSARVWDAATGKPVTPPLVHDGTVVKAVFSPDGRAVLTGSQDGTARAWDAGTGEPLTPPLPVAGWVARVLASSGPVAWELPRDERPLDDLRLLAQAFSGHRIDDTGGLIPLEPDRLREAWETLRKKYPGEFARCQEK